MLEPIHIGISLGNQYNFQDGLGEFSQQLCRHLADKARELKSERGWHLHFHLPEAHHGRFGPDVAYLPLGGNEVFDGGNGAFKIWHTLHQLNRYAPPANTQCRVLTIHDLNFFHKNLFSRYRDWFKIKQLLKRTDHITTVSRYVANDIREKLFWNEPITVIHNGARDLSSAPQEAIDELNGRPFLFHLSRMIPSKNAESLVGLARICPDQLFVFAGPDGRGFQRIKDLCQRQDLKNVLMYADVSDAQKAWLFGNCRAFMFPSLTEGFGLPVIEAMHFGKPVFLSNRTCLPEIGGTSAFYWNNFEPDSMRAVLLQGLQGSNNDSMASTLRHHASQFNWSRCADQYLTLYANLMSAPTATISKGAL